MMTAMQKLYLLNNLRWYFRVPVKWFVLTLTVVVVCFPYPSVLVRHLRHWRNPNALIEPHAEALEPLVDELRPQMTSRLAPPQALQAVERFVYEKIKYEWDWNNWGTADYLPTVTEAVEKGKEDCDGRAVVAASLLKRFGFRAKIVTDFTHMWVQTEYGDTMSPGKRKAIVADEDGLRIRPGALSQLLKGLGYGIAVFPLKRELIVLAVLWLLLLRHRGGPWCNLVALALLASGLVLLRIGGAVYWGPVEWVQMSGVVSLTAGVVSLLVWAKANARVAESVSVPEPAESA